MYVCVNVSDTYANMLPAVGRMMGSLVYRLYCLDHIAMMLQVLLTDKVTGTQRPPLESKRLADHGLSKVLSARASVWCCLEQQAADHGLSKCKVCVLPCGAVYVLCLGGGGGGPCTHAAGRAQDAGAGLPQ